MSKKSEPDGYRVSAKYCSGQKGVPILGNGWELQLYVICGSCAPQSHLTDKGTNYLTGAGAWYPFMFHLTVLSVVQIMYQASGKADWIYQAEQLQKL